MANDEMKQIWKVPEPTLRRLPWYLAFLKLMKGRGEAFVSSTQIAKEINVDPSQVAKAMRSSGNYPLKGEVHVDEFYIGGEEEGIIGRSTEGKKKLVIVALEIVRDGVGRAYAQVIDDASASSFRPFFDRYISKDAKVITDEWSGYLPLKKDYPKLEQRPSDKGKGHPQIHIHIMNIKGWLRGIHHHCSKEHLQGYLDEYHFRFNRRNNMDTIFDMLLRRMICQKKTD